MRIVFLFTLLLLAGCGGSESGNGDSFTLSKAAVDLKTRKSFFNTGSLAEDKIFITTNEKVLAAGMPTGQQKPAWLNFKLTPQTNGTFLLNVQGYPDIPDVNSGIYKSTIRVGTLKNDGSFAKSIDVPVTFDLTDYAEFDFGQGQQLSGRAGSLQNSTGNYEIRTTAAKMQLTTDVNWLSVESIKKEFSSFKFKVQASAQNLPVGKHTGNLIFKSEDGRTTVSKAITFNVEKPRWWLETYAIGLSQFGTNKNLETAITVATHDPKLLQSLQINNDSAWLQTQLIDDQLQLKANTAGLSHGMHYAQVKVGDPKISSDVKTLWVGLFISPLNTSVASIDLREPSTNFNIKGFLADPLRPYVYIQTAAPTPQLQAFNLSNGELLWKIELGDFVLHEISLDGQSLLLKKPFSIDCEMVKISLTALPMTNWAEFSGKTNGSFCVTKTRLIDGIALAQINLALRIGDLSTLRFYEEFLNRLDNTDFLSDFLNSAQHYVQQTVSSPLNDQTIVISNMESGGLSGKFRITQMKTMVLPEQNQVRYEEIANLDNITLREAFLAARTNRLWIGGGFVDLQDSKMSLISVSEHCPNCALADNSGVEGRDGRVALLGQIYSTQVNDVAKRVMIFARNGQIEAGSATNSSWKYGWSFGVNGLQLSADQQWLLIGNAENIEIQPFK